MVILIFQRLLINLFYLSQGRLNFSLEESQINDIVKDFHHFTDIKNETRNAYELYRRLLANFCYTRKCSKN